MTVTTAYFVFTDTFDALAIPRPRTALTAAPPLLSVTIPEGWSLVPVLSSQFPPPRERDAEDYFSTITWVKAITYSPLTGNWESIQSGETLKTLAMGDPDFTTPCGVTHAAPTTAGTKTIKAQVCIGKGYWLWVTKAGTLIP